MEERICLELRIQKSQNLERDENGNYMVWVEASNESLDYDEQVVLQKALLESADYFLKNGIISYDHRHLRRDPTDTDWNPEKYIIGEPLEVRRHGLTTLVKCLLYKSNRLVQEIIGKVRDGSTRVRASIAGKKPTIVKAFDRKLRKLVEKVSSILWDELAITPKPVNQTLAPAALSPEAFVKSLQAGYETDAAKMTGGQSLIPQDLEGAGEDEVGRHKKNVTAVIMALVFGDVGDAEQARKFLQDRGYSGAESDRILKTILRNHTRIKELVR